jgi:hypothetical protein
LLEPPTDAEEHAVRWNVSNRWRRRESDCCQATPESRNVKEQWIQRCADRSTSVVFEQAVEHTPQRSSRGKRSGRGCEEENEKEEICCEGRDEWISACECGF